MNEEKYFTFGDLQLGYKISLYRFKKMLKNGELKYIKFNFCLWGGSKFEYLIPESELTKLEQYKFSEPRFMIEHQPSYVEKQREMLKHSQEVKRQMAEARNNGMTQEEAYHKIYLHSQYWKEKREEVFRRAGYKCQICGTAINVDRIDKKEPGQIHHRTYDYLGNEPIENLIAVCKKCHSELHKKDLQKKQNEQEKSVQTFNLFDLFDEGTKL